MLQAKRYEHWFKRNVIKAGYYKLLAARDKLR